MYGYVSRRRTRHRQRIHHHQTILLKLDTKDNILKHLLITLTTLLSISTATSQHTDDLDMSQLIMPADSANFFAIDNHFVWDNCVIKDSATNTYHLFYAMWPKAIGYSSWLTHSKIYRAHATHPSGPYTGQHLVLTHGEKNRWDELSVFNVKIAKFGDTYSLYYCASNATHASQPINDSILRQVGAQGFGHPLWMPIRNSQRSGMATSHSLFGPWKNPSEPFAGPVEGLMANIANNPTVTATGDGKYILMIKGDHPAQGHNKTIQTVGIGDTPGGPFTMINKPAFDDIPTEDATIWYDKKRERFYAIFHAAGENFLGLITSVDGVSWQRARHFFVCKKEIPLNDGTTLKVERMERPSIFLENGVPSLFSTAIKQGSQSFICFFTLKTNN